LELFSWLQNLPLSEWVQTSDYGFPLLLAAHSIGLAGVVGVLVILNLRVLGFAGGIPIAALSRLMPVAWIGFSPGCCCSWRTRRVWSPIGRSC
jgi:Na+/H+-dicarboxylate symporter